MAEPGVPTGAMQVYMGDETSTVCCAICGVGFSFGDWVMAFDGNPSGFVHEPCVRESFYYSCLQLSSQLRELMMLFFESIKIPQLVEWLDRKLR